jgi:hypothetical protein
VIDQADRNAELLSWLVPNPNLPPRLRELAERFERLALELAELIPSDSIELEAALRALLISKDAAVRALLRASR